MTTFPGAGPSRILTGKPPTGQSEGRAPGRVGVPAPVHQSEAEVNRIRGHGSGEAKQTSASASGSRSGLPVDARMASRLGGAGRSEPTLLHVTWLPWPVRLIHTRGAL